MFNTFYVLWKDEIRIVTSDHLWALSCFVFWFYWAHWLCC